MAKTTKRHPNTALAKVSPQQLAAPTDSPTLMFERLAKDPTVPVEKLEKLIELQERIMAFNAKAAFDSAFAIMQSEIPEIDERGRIIIEGQAPRPYSKNEDIQLALRPVLAKHGFALSFKTEWPERGVRIIGILSHRDGHTRESVFESAADSSGKKNAIQALGSTISYGHRYTTKDLLNVTSRGEDSDGHGTEPRKARAPKATVVDVPPAGHHAQAGDAITDAQRRRLWTIIRKTGRKDEDVKAWLAVAYNVSSSKLITRRDYDAIVSAVEKPGPLPAPREPGEDDE